MNAKKTKTTVARDVDDYLARLPEDSRLALEKLRSTIKSVVPDSVEVISYQIPTFKYQGACWFPMQPSRSIAAFSRVLDQSRLTGAS